MTMANGSRHALVVGAGLAGLAAGFRLKQAGWTVTVLETRNYPGGRAASIHKDGYLIDTGATGIGDCYTEYMALADEVGLTPVMRRSSQITATLRDGKLYELDGDRPIRSGFFSRLFSWQSKLLMLRMFGDLKAMGNSLSFQDVSLGWEVDCESAENYALRRLNRELLEYFVDPVLRALVVARASEVSRLELMNAMNGLFSTKLMAPLGGMTVLPTVLADLLDMKYDSEATAIRVKDGGVEVDYTDLATGHCHQLLADGCVLATLLPQAVDIYPPCQNWVAPLADDLHYIPGICVHLGYALCTHSKALMTLISKREIPDITLIWLEHNKADDRAPPGHSLLYLYYDDAVRDRVFSERDEILVAQCRKIVESLYPELRGHFDMSEVTRWDAAVPKPEPGYYRRMRKVRENLDTKNRGRVQLAGDYLSCVGQNTAVHYGNEAARHLIDIVG